MEGVSNVSTSLKKNKIRPAFLRTIPGERQPGPQGQKYADTRPTTPSRVGSSSKKNSQSRKRAGRIKKILPNFPSLESRDPKPAGTAPNLQDEQEPVPGSLERSGRWRNTKIYSQTPPPPKKNLAWSRRTELLIKSGEGINLRPDVQPALTGTTNSFSSPRYDKHTTPSGLTAYFRRDCDVKERKFSTVTD